jgi:CDP-glycerol glycerophosphotransferase (TagB/SpsB family)
MNIITILKDANKDNKMIINDPTFNSLDTSISFTIQNQEIDLTNAKISLIERSSRIEWVEETKLSIDTHTGNYFITFDLSKFITTYYNQNSRWDLYLSSYDHSDVSKKSRLRISEKKATSNGKRYLASASTDGVHLVTPYITELNELSLIITEPAILEDEKLNANLTIVKFNMSNNIISGKAFLQISDAQSFCVKSLILKYRSKTDYIKYTFSVKEEKKTETTSTLKFCIDLSQLVLQNYYWDFYLEVEINHKKHIIRMKNPTFKVRRQVNKKSVKQAYIYQNNFYVQPYITAANTVALLYKKKEDYETSSFYYKEKLAYFLYILFKWYFDRKNIWLAFEKFSETAQDNAFYFFNYCYKNKKQKNFFYIIKKDSPDYINVKLMEDKVLHYMSFKYMVYLFAAKLLISSESKGHVYDIRIQKGLLKKALNHKTQVFLQHGVIGLKRVDQIFKKGIRNSIGLFVVSSENEKNIIKNNFGYKDKEIIVTGLSRWDVLKDESKKKASILLMPTWRSWMDDLPEDKFVQTEYYQHYVSLLNSHKIDNLLKEYNIHLNFYIHPKFKAYIDKFSSNNKRIRIYQYGEEKVNQLLMKSSMLITDYSSVSWDMFYQKKPIVFYQFDLDDYIKYQGSYIDMETELFGDQAKTVDSLIGLIKKYAENNFKEEPKYAFLRETYLKYTDQQNSSRIYQEIINNYQRLTKRKLSFTIMESDLLMSIWFSSKKNKTIYHAANMIKKHLIENK